MNLIGFELIRTASITLSKCRRDQCKDSNFSYISVYRQPHLRACSHSRAGTFISVTNIRWAAVKPIKVCTWLNACKYRYMSLKVISFNFIYTISRQRTDVDVDKTALLRKHGNFLICLFWKCSVSGKDKTEWRLDFGNSFSQQPEWLRYFYSS